jgi:PAS domain S-box-containing protein
MIPESSLEAPIASLTRRILLVSVLIIVLAFGAGLLLAGGILGPIRRLTGAAEILSKGDLQSRVAVTTADELGQLGGSFNVMAERLEQIIKSEQQTNRRLEDEIIERKRGEEVLRTSEEKYRTLFDSIDVGVCTIEVLFDGNEKPVDYRFLEVNPSFEKQTGIQNAPGRRMREIAPLHEEHWFEMYGRIALTGEPARFENQAMQLHRWYDVYAFRVGEPQERHVAIHFKDITERKQGEEEMRQLNAQLETANKELEAFSYSVSHDLRAPLRHIDGFVQLLTDHMAGRLDAEGTRHLSTIARSAKRMGVLIDDLLVFSRMAKSEMRLSQVSSERLVREVINDLQAETQNREIAWTIGDLPEVYGDAAMLRQVWANLIGNAVKYTRPRARAEIEIGGAPEGTEWVFVIRDNGVGFDPEYAGKLFGVFQRLHRADEFEGTGIGLANVRRIVHRHGGRTWADGSVDGGAVFHFSLPRREETTG